MNTPDADKIKNTIKNASQTEVGKEVVGAVEGIASGKVREIRKMAADKGLGGVFDSIENLAEKQVGIDLDGDGDIGK